MECVPELTVAYLAALSQTKHGLSGRNSFPSVPLQNMPTEYRMYFMWKATTINFLVER